MTEETVNQGDIIVRRNYYDALLAELAELRNLQIRVKNAFEQINMPIHATSLGAGVEELVLRWVALGQENNDLRVENARLRKSNVALAQQLFDAQAEIASLEVERPIPVVTKKHQPWHPSFIPPIDLLEDDEVEFDFYSGEVYRIERGGKVIWAKEP